MPLTSKKNFILRKIKKKLVSNFQFESFYSQIFATARSVTPIPLIFLNFIHNLISFSILFFLDKVDHLPYIKNHGFLYLFEYKNLIMTPIILSPSCYRF